MAKTITLSFDAEYVTAELWINGNLEASFIPNESFDLENLPISGGVLWLVPQEGVEITSAKIEDYSAAPWAPVIITPSLTDGDKKGFDLESTGFMEISSYLTDGESYEIEIDTLGEPGSPSNKTSLYNRVYLLNEEQALEFAKSPLGFIISGGSESVEINRSEFIVNLVQVPFDVSSDYILGTSKIIVADIELDLEVDTLSSDLIGLDFGEIVVSELEGNILDFVNAEYSLIIPNVDLEVEIEPHEIVGKVISIVAVIDAYNGDLTLNLYNGGEKPFKSEKNKIGRIIPTTISNAYAHQSLDLGNSSGFFNSIEGAYIKVTKEKLEEGKDINLVKDVSLVSEISGYFEVTYYEDLIGDNSEDQQAVKNILETGVLIK